MPSPCDPQSDRSRKRAKDGAIDRNREGRAPLSIPATPPRSGRAVSAWLHMVTHPVYWLACFLVGLVGMRRRPGYFGFTGIALLLTPIIALLMLMGVERHRRHEGHR